MLRCAIVPLLASVLIVAGGNQPRVVADSKSQAKGADNGVAVDFPSDFPLGLATVVASRPIGNARQAGTFKLTHAGLNLNQSVGQYDSATGRVWCFVTLHDKSLLGKPVRIEAVPADVKPIVTVLKKDGGFEFFDDGRSVLFYQQDAKSKDGKYIRANYVHPLRGLDGRILTQDFPDDHPHHRGIFWAWHQLRVQGQKAGDSWATRDGLSVVKRADILNQGPVFATLKVVADWTSPLFTDESGNPKPILEETTSIRLFHATADSQFLDFEITLQPLFDDVKIGGAENVKEYSGFTARVRPPREMKITDANGELTGDGQGRTSSWSDTSGKFGDDDTYSGLGVLCHRSQPQFPPRWLLRHYGMQNCIYPGRHATRLPVKKPVVLRHRLVIHAGNVVQARIADQQAAYENSP